MTTNQPKKECCFACSPREDDIVCRNMNCPCHKRAEKPYNQRDHSHCWESETPPCGLKGKHLRCCLCELVAPTTDTAEKKCTAFTNHDHWCDCGHPSCWEEELRLKVKFDKNADREVCILFVHRMLKRAQVEGYKKGQVDEAIAHIKEDMDVFKAGKLVMLEEVRKGLTKFQYKDTWHEIAIARNAAFQDVLALLDTYQREITNNNNEHEGNQI